MADQLGQTLQALREQILSGQFVGGEKLRETALAKGISVSRTLVRLALSELEREGLVEREPNKGFRVRSYSLDDVADAILVRGELESMAARRAAEMGLAEPLRAHLTQIVQEMDEVLRMGFGNIEHQVRWINLNGAFHDGIVAASGSSVLQETVEQLSRLPLASSRAIVFDQTDPTKSESSIARAQDDHHNILQAIIDRQGARAQACMQSHALLSSRNKRNSIDAMRQGQLGPKLPGLDLVSG